jgi:serine/threonine protein kinase
MAPEVFEERYSTKADIWSVGCVAVQMATGNPPWKDIGLTNPVSLFQHISKSSGPPLWSTNDAELICGLHNGAVVMESFQKLISHCFERTPELRPSSGDMLDHIFFSDDTSLLVDDHSDSGYGLFSSPLSTGSATKHTICSSPNWATNLSPILQRPTIRRCNSSGSTIRSPMFSPPLPRRTVGGREMVQLRMDLSPTSISSPTPDDTEWPTWARNQLPAKSSSETVKISDSLHFQGDERKDPITVDSLVYSDDDRESSSVLQEGLADLFSPPLLGVSIISSAPDASPLQEP